MSYARKGVLPLQSRRRPVMALDGVDLDIRKGETLALVGESGSGKSTLARVLVRTIEPNAGTVMFRGADISALEGGALRAVRRHLQIIFQDPFSSLNPRRSIGAAIAEPLIVHVSASASRAPSPAGPTSSSPTRRYPRSTCRCRGRSWTCSRI